CECGQPYQVVPLSRQGTIDLIPRCLWYHAAGEVARPSVPVLPLVPRYHMATKQPARLRVVTLASTKGGVGKTTLASALAVRAAEDSRRVALLERDPQESLASWWIRRGKVKNPKLFEVDATAEAIELLVSEGWEWIFIDTGPARIELIEPGIAVADLVLIP